jgi:hypothetical protein
MRKKFSEIVLSVGLISFFILGFWFGFYVLNLPIMACMFVGAGFGMLPLMAVIAKDNS